MVDVIKTLANPKDASDYWTTVKKRLKNNENSELPTKCRKLNIYMKINFIKISNIFIKLENIILKLL